ncbi:allantoate amidohydrolase [Sphingobium cupriresistens]|uniref:Allantoate amidohydrolase n=1 Tax=Sphingobium cupriresistens TaxID=1132417 RepID=A0A8G1ZK52_9SPHN|nr:allantoate amidohydrolase [Sphingobium cupriresistens]RYM13834.1 allantoate amidohydrolase [Sphingobium cupriresistens]
MVSGGARAVARCDALGVAPYSDMADGLYRGYLTPAYAHAQAALAGWMGEAGMAVRRDPAANLIGRYEGQDPAAPALLIGSHIDSVRDAGRYDGPLGIMLGVEAVAALHRAGRRLPFPIEVIAFGDEEGSRFPAAMLTSRAVAGTLAAEALDLRDGDGLALADAGVDVRTYLSAARPAGATLAYLEAHIEQGPVLEAQGLALGTVTGIAAQLRYQLTLRGMAGHAGTTSMPLRRDALAGAAEAMLAIETLARDAASDLVATVGRIEALPGAPNVIPGEVRFTLDVRSGDAGRRNRAAEAMIEAIAAIADRRGLDWATTLVHDLPASPCDSLLMTLMDAAIAGTGQPAFRLVSGAGHDAMVMAALCPTAMLFIRCRHGISHHPAEHVDPADAERALQAMLGFIDKLGESIAAA